MILDTLPDIGVQFQDTRNIVVQSAVDQIEFYMKEIGNLDELIEEFLKKFNCTLTSMVGIDTVTAAQILSCIGDIRKFPTPAKLARYAGIAPVDYASGRIELKYANQRGNRELNSIIFWLAVRLSVPLGGNRYISNSFFYNYYNRKISEGKTKRQAIKCVERRLINIIWSMLMKNEEYINPPMIEAPKDETEEKSDKPKPKNNRKKKDIS